MKDEYGSMDDSGDSFTVSDFLLENGAVLKNATLRYRMYGELNEARDNVLVICHALTGNASVHAWWGGLLGDGKAFDTSRYCVVCANILGSCYGSTNPQSVIDSSSDETYGEAFPDISVQDTVRLQLRMLREHLNISSVAAVIGGSFGGMQAVEYMVQCAGTDYVRTAIPIACGAQHTAWQIGISQVQRNAVKEFGIPGLALARQMAMLSYRTPAGYHTKFGRAQQAPKDGQPAPPPYGEHAQWSVQSYLDYQGRKFLDRFDPITYIKLTEQMDTHDVTRGRSGTVAEVLGRVKIPALVLGIDSDILYPLSEQETLADGLANAELKVIRSPDGHDGFLLEQEQVGGHITEFLRKHRKLEEESASSQEAVSQ